MQISTNLEDLDFVMLTNKLVSNFTKRVNFTESINSYELIFIYK